MSQKSLSNEQQRLVEDNMNLVYFVLQKYYPTYKFDQDLMQIGMEGLCYASMGFDETKGKFSTYASKCIRNQIRHELREREKYKNDISYEGMLEQLDK